MLFEVSRPTPTPWVPRGYRGSRLPRRATKSVPRASSKTPETTPFPLSSSSSSTTSSTIIDLLANLPPLALKEWSPVVASLLSGRSTLLLRKGGIKETKFVPRARSFALVPTSFHVDGGVVSFDLTSSPRSSPRPPPLSSAFSPDFDQRSPSGVDIEGVAVVTGAWALSTTTTTKKEEEEEEELLLSAAVDALSDFHPFRRRSSSDSSSSSSSSSSSPQPPLLRRLGFRPGIPVTLLEIRAFHLDPVVHVSRKAAQEGSYWGCRSWVELCDEESRRVRESAKAAAAATTTAALDDVEFCLRAKALREALHSRLPEGCVVEPLEI